MRRWWRALCDWVDTNFLLRRLRRLQTAQLAEHHQIVTEVKQRRRALSQEMGDVILRLDAVTDQLEESISRRRREADG